MGAGVILIKPGQLVECRDVGVAQSRLRQGVAVALAFVPAADGIVQRFEQHRQERQRKHQERQRVNTERGVIDQAGVADQNPVADPESEDTVEPAGEHHFGDVMIDMVANFMGKDDLDLVEREFRQQRVAQDHPARPPQPGQHGVGLDRFLAQAQPVDALNRQPRALGQPRPALG